MKARLEEKETSKGVEILFLTRRYSQAEDTWGEELPASFFLQSEISSAIKRASSPREAISWRSKKMNQQLEDKQ